MVEPSVIVPAGVAIIAAAGAYLASVRKLSGSIDTSTADQLWTEARSIRQDYQRRIEELNKVVASLQARLDAREVTVDELELENKKLRTKIGELRERITSLQAEKADLRLTKLEDDSDE